MSTIDETLPSAANLESRLQFETLISDLVSNFINIPPSKVDGKIEDAMRQICEPLGIDLATLWQWSVETPGVFTFTHAYRAQWVPQTAEPSSEVQFPWVVGQIRAGRTVAIPSVEELPPEAAVDRANGRLGGIKSALAVPLSIGGGTPIGAMGFNTLRAYRDWPDAMVTRLQLVAQVFANALTRMRADHAMHDLSRRLISAHEDERALLARELHDDVTQRLAVLAIQAGRAERAVQDESQAGAMRAVREELVRLSEDIHSLAYQLHPAVLTELGLAEGLRAECERRARQGSLAVSSDIDPLPAVVAKDAALCLFRVAQEALNNVSRHAGARSAQITLRRVDGGLLLAVRDEGAGFDPAQPGAGRHLGLSSMRERVRLMNGTFDIESAPGQGTTVVAWVPTGEGSR